MICNCNQSTKYFIKKLGFQRELVPFDRGFRGQRPPTIKAMKKEQTEMIKHIVMFKLKDTEGKTEYENALEAKERFNDVIENVEVLKKGELVINSKDAPQDNYTISLICDFDSIDDLNAYQVHPNHVAFAKFLGTVKTDRACIDYEY